MSDRRLAILVEVEGNAKAVFKEIGVAAKQSAQEVTQSGQRAQQGIERIEKAADGAEKQVAELEVAQKKAAKAADEMAQHSAKAGTSLDRYRDSAKQAGAGMALLGTAFTMYANQARDHEINMIALQRVYGDAADSYVAFADRIQNTSIFSNDQALEAARIMGTLKTNYGMTDEAIQQLIQTSADLATISGVSLVDAAQRVQSAIRGEAESAEWLSLTMNQAAIDTEGVTLTMSQAEAAGYRFEQMMGQAAFSVGAAAEAANTTTGQVQQLTNEFQDAALAVVGFTGPVGQVAAGLGGLGMEAGLAAGGLVQLSRGVRSLMGVGGLAGLAASLAGPAGIAIAAGAAGYALWQLFNDVEDSGIVAFERATVATDNLGDSIDVAIERIKDARVQLNLLGDQESFAGLTAQIERQLVLFQKWGDPSFWQNGTPLNWIDTGNPADLAAAQAEWEELIALNGRLGDSTQTMAAQVANAYGQIINNTGAGADAALQTAMNWVDAWQAGEITLVELNDRLNGVIADLPNYKKQAIEAAEATRGLAQAAESAADAYSAMEVARGNVNVKTQAEIELIQKRLRMFHVTQTALDAEAMALLGLDMTVNQIAKSYDDLFPVIEQTARATEDAAGAFSQLTADMKGTDIARVTAEYEAAMLAATGLGEALYGLQARGGSVSVDLAINTGNAQSALQSGFGAAVGGAQGMGRLADQTAEWAASLTEGNIGQSKLDDLLLKGAISQTTYRRALEANHRIQIANQSVQEDVLRIQAKQLPAMAELAESHARYVDSLADASVQEQAAALGFMDQSKAAQAVAVANMNATAAMAGTSEQAGKMTIAMAEADPYLRAMLLQMEVIKEGADGEITMNTDDAVSATDVLSELNTTIGDLKTLLAQIFLVQVDIEDNASGPLSYIDGLLSQLDGKTANVYINTLGGNTIGFVPEAATGTHIFPESARNLVAKVDAMATGGHIDDLVNGSGRLTLVGEAGAELVSLPTGSTVTNAAGTRGRLDPMGRGRRSGNGGDIIINGTNHMTVVRDDSALTHRQRELAKRRR